jgi:ATP adenylyltransferase/5',5'''-P-1,P-4-tetraphosphate phosphorylase II
MSSNTHLRFNSHIGRQKPESIVNRETACPFCNRSQLSGILAEEGNIIWLKNKYPVLEDTLQTVIIETHECDSDLSLYTPDHLHRLFRFAFAKWQDMSDSGDYASVLFYKNHGPYSGGTIRHPHMQIVGLKYVDAMQHVEESQFTGIVIAKRQGVELNVSTLPRVGFVEFNVLLDDLRYLDDCADFTQIAVHYIMNHFSRNCNSYNLFFYELHGEWRVKIVPRFVTSPLYVGFGIPQVSDRIDEVAEEIKERYFVEQERLEV